jgi:putative transposase
MRNISYAKDRFPPEIIQYAVWLYFRFPLSYRDVEDLLSEELTFLMKPSGAGL